MKTKCALIGYTGFIGSNLLDFNKKLIKYNSKNIYKIRNRKFDIVICAGTSSKIWLSKKNPIEDKKKIKNLIDNLQTIKTKKFVHLNSAPTATHSPILIGVAQNFKIKS